MNLYNSYVLKGKEGIKESYSNAIKYEEIKPGKEPMPGDCIQCGVCETLCTQKLDIIERLKWLDQHVVV